MRILHRRGLILALLVAVAIGLVIGPGSPTQAAPTATKPLQQVILLAGGCGANSLVRTEYNVSRTPQTSDTANWLWVDQTQSATGNLKTDIYVKNSYNRYDVYLQCAGGKRYKIVDPTNYVHKEKYVNWACELGCVPMYTTQSGWLERYCIRGADGKLCMW